MVYRDDYSKTSGSSRQCCSDETVSNDDGENLNFDGNNITDSFKSKTKNIVLACSENLIVFNAAVAATFATTDTKLYISVVILSFQDNSNLWQHINQELNEQLTEKDINQK